MRVASADQIEESARTRYGVSPHWVLCSLDKRPHQSGWQKFAPDIATVEAHLERGLPVGIIPASLGYAVVDVDHGGEAAEQAVIARLGQPVGVIRTPRGGAHLYYRCARTASGEAQGNMKWAIPEGDGDIRGSRGFVVAWDLATLLEIVLSDDGEPVDVSRVKTANLPATLMPAAVREAPEGTRNDLLNRATYAQSRQGTLDVREMTKAGLDAGLSPDEVRRTIQSAVQGATQFRGRVMKKTPEDLEIMLADLHLDIRYNERSQRTEYNPAESGWREMDDLAEDNLIHLIARTYITINDRPLLFGKEAWQSCLNALLHTRRCDPFLEYLQSLPPWDQQPRLDKCISAVFSAVKGDPSLAEWAGKSVFMGAVLRTLQPGAKHDEMVVLVGAQGTGKSTWCQSLIDTQRFPDFYTDGLHMASPNRERVEAIAGAVIVECSEMAGTTRAELESLKAFLSRSTDRVRLSYRRNPESIPRRSIIIGTTNETNSLPNDPTGNRRFVPIIVSGDPIAVSEWISLHREQLWAEALHRVRDLNEIAHLPAMLAPIQQEATEDHRRADEIIEDRVERWINQMDRDGFTMEDIVIGLGYEDMTTDQRLANRIGKTLTLKGFIRRRTRFNGVQKMRWFAK